MANTLHKTVGGPICCTRGKYVMWKKLPNGTAVLVRNGTGKGILQANIQFQLDTCGCSMWELSNL